MNRPLPRLLPALLGMLLCGFPAYAAAKGDSDKAAVEKRAEQQSCWIHIDPGVRPAFVGIQGGTAPISLGLCPDGSILALNGASGNDFTKILHKNPPAPAPVLPVAEQAPLPPAGSQLHAGPGSSAILPLGLDRPESEAAPGRTLEVRVASGGPLKPLKLGSYKQVLGAAGRS